MSCPIYPKIDTLYDRGDDFKVDEARIRRPEFTIPREWLVTEKIHGCNVRVSLEPLNNVYNETDDYQMRFNGRKENSQMPTLLMAYLQDTFTVEGLKSLWRCKKNCDECGGEGWTDATDCGRAFCSKLEPYPITLYGEGYGGRIQKGGGKYTSKIKGGAASFRLFDVLVGETWLRRADVEDVASKLGIKCVPLLGADMPIDQIVLLVKTGQASIVAGLEGTPGHQAEGIVAFTEEPLYNNRGQRLMFKLKTEDFA